VIPIAEDRLASDEALKVDCNDIQRRLFQGLPAPYVEGFVIIKVRRVWMSLPSTRAQRSTREET
jgi:hypothetical protein